MRRPTCNQVSQVYQCPLLIQPGRTRNKTLAAAFLKRAGAEGVTFIWRIPVYGENLCASFCRTFNTLPSYLETAGIPRVAVNRLCSRSFLMAQHAYTSCQVVRPPRGL